MQSNLWCEIKHSFKLAQTLHHLMFEKWGIYSIYFSFRSKREAVTISLWTQLIQRLAQGSLLPCKQISGEQPLAMYNSVCVHVHKQALILGVGIGVLQVLIIFISVTHWSVCAWAEITAVGGYKATCCFCFTWLKAEEAFVVMATAHWKTLFPPLHLQPVTMWLESMMAPRFLRHCQQFKSQQRHKACQFQSYFDDQDFTSHLFLEA